MTESLGLAGQGEIPLVIVVAQRPGPATGLATWTAQGDLRFVIHAAQGEFPRLVAAPGDIEECFYTTIDAHNFAEKYQVPVIILEDKYLSESSKTVEKFNVSNVKLDRGCLARPEDLEVEEINSIIGENNKIRIEIIPNTEQMSKKLKDIGENTTVESGFMIDTVIQNEGIEKEPLWRSLSGWSRFAWKLHFKVWSITEEMDPVKAISQETEQENTGEIYFTNPTNGIQMFLIIPRNLVESYGQVVAHPGGDTAHIMTERDKNTFLMSEEIGEEDKENGQEENKEKVQERIKEWTEEGAMAISWSLGQTGSISREVIVEHRLAHPRLWTFLTFAVLVFILGTNIRAEIFPFSMSMKIRYFWEICLILFVFSYFYTNLYNFSFYELKKKTGLRFFIVFLRIPIISIIVVFAVLSRIEPPIPAPEQHLLLVIIAAVALVFGSSLTYVIENEKIKRRDIKIREHEKASYMLWKIVIQIAAICFVGSLTILAFGLDKWLFPVLFACVYGITVFLETSEGKAIKWLQI